MCRYIDKVKDDSLNSYVDSNASPRFKVQESRDRHVLVSGFKEALEKAWQEKKENQRQLKKYFYRLLNGIKSIAKIFY